MSLACCSPGGVLHLGPLRCEGLRALVGTYKEKGTTVKEHQLSFGASTCRFGCVASGEVQKQDLQMEKFHFPSLAKSEARRSLSAADSMPGGLGAPDQVEKIAQIYTHLSRRRIYAHLTSQMREHLHEETITLV